MFIPILYSVILNYLVNCKIFFYFIQSGQIGDQEGDQDSKFGDVGAGVILGFLSWWAPKF